MCHKSCILFGVNYLTEEEIKNKKVIDVGSRDYNGNYSVVVKRLKPKEYIGVDMLDGPGVDIVCNAENLIETFGKDSFDVVISSELMEHARNWRKVISNLKNVLKPGGLLILTTRSKGFKLHGYPFDYWRYELDDFKEIFSDLEILALEKDSEAPGVFMKARKPLAFKERSTQEISLYSIIEKKRINTLSDEKEKSFKKRYDFYKYLVRSKRRFEGFLSRLAKSLLRL